MAKQTPAQKETVERVMHEFKHGELRTGQAGPKVKSRRQALAIALHESGSTNQESPKENRKNLARTKQKERKGQTAQAAAETGPNATKAGLYEQAKKRDIPGRSRMSKAELARALGR
ncbi:DUF6496 domain-containing protein [Enterovirga sp.]|jgi:hypothetical protein|uniref:DUF6496 domain-containing protein n=1 Tax=Enterovirga sp. TaxID=2026350 RepID=UPI002606569E|nr:DUF6496 domain-containing protein [Enterovirga sp.]MDB5591232.1 hypothetical protein [Enterovirga sp.]